MTATLSNGVPGFVLQGGRGFAYTVRTSTNLTAWSVLGTFGITNANGAISIADTNSATARYRFFDAILP